MEGQAGQAPTGQPQQQQPQQVPPQQSPSLIRTDQVAKLPHLTEAQKLQQTQYVRGLWEILNSQPQTSDEFRNAQMKLVQVSQNLMKGMQMYKQRMQQQQQQQAQAQVQAQVQAQGAASTQAQGQQQPQQRPQATNNPTAFNQLLPAIQAKVNSLQFHLPPAVNPQQATSWLNEAKLRYGMAVQKQEMGKQRIMEVRQQVQARNGSGTISQEEMQELRNRQAQAEKLFREGTEFLKKFQEQQEQFKAARGMSGGGGAVPGGQQAPGQGQAQTQAQQGQGQGQGQPGVTGVSASTGQAQTPAPHTVNSAVNAARVQGQTQQPQQPSQPQAAMSSTPTLPQAGTPATQAAFTQPQTQAQGQQQQQQQPPGQQTDGQGPPRPLSHEAAISQAAKSYQGNKQQPPQQQQAGTPQGATNPNANPPGYMANRSVENTTRNVNMAIPKNLNIQPPEPVAMGTPRPTLSSGPSHGAMGVMGQPAIQKHPGYVLEGEGQRVLSKKMLDILVRQVTGGGEGEGLTPDAEEFILQMADDFVDDVITAACRLAKLRPSSTLEIRDIQLVLERNYNMRISGFSTDDLRTVKKPQPAQGWTQKMSAVQAAKVTQGKAE